MKRISYGQSSESISSFIYSYSLVLHLSWESHLTLVARIDLLLDRSGLAFALDVANHSGEVGNQLDVGLMED